MYYSQIIFDDNGGQIVLRDILIMNFELIKF